MLDRTSRKLGVACVGLGGGVATTAIAGLELIRQGSIAPTGLPLGDREIAGVIDTGQIAFTGWDFDSSDLAAALRTHNVLTEQQIHEVTPRLSQIIPRPALMDERFCRNINGTNIIRANTRRGAANQIKADIEAFRISEGLDDVVVMNLASTEKVTDLAAPALASIEAFERALDADDDALSPAMIYAYAAITSGCAYGNFTPSAAGEIPALLQLAERYNVPLAGRDGKTGQTFLKTVLAPAFKARALHVDGWYSTNILGNRDGEALADPASLASKLNTKGDVLNDILGYEVKDHIVQIQYYPPRGDEKEAWDNIDVSGFLGQKMQIKVNFLCRDSILAAPLVIDIARCLDVALRRGESGPIEALGVFFKAPMSRDGHPVHAFHEQIAAFDNWISDGVKVTVPAQ